MKDAKNHLKYIQKKVVKSVKKEEEKVAQPNLSENPVSAFKRPKTIPNKRKIA